MADLPRLRAALAASLRESDGDGHPTHRFCHALAESLPVDGAAISLMTGADAREAIYPSDDVIAAVDELELTLGEGPCLEAFTSGGPVLLMDAGPMAAGRWPVFAAGVAGLPIGGLFAFPVQIGAIQVGVMELYRRAPGPLTPQELGEALAAAEMAAVALLGMHDRGPPGAVEGGWLDDVVLDRAEVYQATGMVMVQLEMGAADAFARLCGHAFATDRVLGDVASDVVNRRLRLDGEPPPNGQSDGPFSP